MDTNFRGPVNNMGALEDSPATVQPLDGPMGSYQGQALLDIRQTPFPKDGMGAARAVGFLDNARIVTINNIPSATTTVSLAAAAALTTATPMVLTTTNPAGTAGVCGLAVGVPIIPYGSSTVTTAALAIDFGFATGTTAAASSAIIVNDLTLFDPGQWIVIGGVANSGKTASLITQVQTVPQTLGTGTITVLPVPAAALSNAPIGAANQWNLFTPPGTQFGPAAVSANAWSPHLAGGLLRLQNPAEMNGRCVSITGAASTAAGGTLTVAGWDVYRQPMTETITKAAGTTTSFGRKAFGFIKSVTPNFADTITYSIGVGDTFGFPIRQDWWENTEIMYGGIRVVTSTGTLAPDLSTATSTTGDVRGTVQLSTNGASTAVAAPVAAATDGVKRLMIVQTIPLISTLNGTPLNTVSIFGNNQA